MNKKKKNQMILQDKGLKIKIQRENTEEWMVCGNSENTK
jgi:hypothetical protein